MILIDLLGILNDENTNICSSTLELPSAYFCFIQQNSFNSMPRFLSESDQERSEFWQTLRGKIDDLWIMIIPDWLQSELGWAQEGLFYCLWVTFKTLQAFEQKLIIGWPQNIFIVVSRYSFQFSNNVCFDRITLNSNGWLFWISLWCRNGIILIFCPLIQRLRFLVWRDFHFQVNWKQPWRLGGVYKHEKSPVLLTHSHFESWVAYSQILWFMGVNKKLLGPAIGRRGERAHS